MGIWDDNYPQNNIAANQIHTYIQNTKQDVIERLRSYNGNNYEHLVFDINATGRHLISSVGFLKIFTDVFSAEAWIDINHPEDGAVITDETSLYLIKGGDLILSSTIDHGALSNIDNDDHSQYMKTDGSRAATGNFNLTSITQLSWLAGSSSLDNLLKTLSGTDALVSPHAGYSWYTAHGVNSLWQRHFADMSVPLGAISWATRTVYVTHGAPGIYYTTNPEFWLDAITNRWSSFPMASGASAGRLMIRYVTVGNKSWFNWGSDTDFYIAMDTITNGASV